MSDKIIRFRIVTVTKKASAEVSTMHYTYEKPADPKATGIERKSVRTEGAEWEEIEFTIEGEEQPTIGISNIVGNAFLAGNPKLIVNNPDLFGLYKVGDVIEFIPVLAVGVKPN